MRRRPILDSNQVGAAVVTVAIVVVLVAVLFLVAIHTAATVTRNQVRHSWEASLGTFEDVIRRHPRTETDARALEVERIAASLGVDIVPRSVEDRPRPDAEAKREFERFKERVFANYVTSMLQRSAVGRLDEPPAELREYFARHDDTLRALRSTLASGGFPPVWHSDLSQLMEAPIPNLLGHINLVKLMTAAAIERLAAGDEPTALEYLDASWQLTRSLRDSPVVINQLITIAETRMMLGALRHVESVPDAWLERLEFDHREAFLRSMKHEGWVWAYMDTGDFGGGDSWWEKLTGVVANPYAEYCLAKVSDAWRERMENLERVESICDYDLSAHEADLNIPIPRWNYIGEILVPNLDQAVERVARLELDVELTRLTIQAKRALPANDATAVDGLQRTTPSFACSADSWESSVLEGELHIAFSRPIEWPNQIGTVLPTEVVIRTTGAPSED